MLSVLAALILLAAGATDIHSRVIPDTFSIALLGLGAIDLLLMGDAAAALSRVALVAAALAVGFAAFTTGLVGGGDVKLLTATTIWITPALYPAFLMVTALAGALAALLVLAVRALRRHVLAKPADGPPTVPYGAAIALGACTILFLER